MARTELITTTTLLFLILPFFAAADDDVQTLLSIKQGFNNPPSLLSWNTSNGPHCNWTGVACAPATGAVTALQLTSQELHGELPDTICDLANLTVLDLTNNYISGGFPSVLYRCNQLRHLNLSQNLLVGAIPDDIARLTALRELNLSGNNFTGDIPRGIGRLASLEVLNLQNNLLNGSVPPEIGDLQNLAVLILAFNPFSPAEIRPEIGRLKRLSYLYLRYMNLIGPIPESFDTLTVLERLDVCQNQLTGSIPAGILRLPNLKILYLYQNKLTGEIPRQILSTRLEEIDLSQNLLTGTLPPQVASLENLTVLYLEENGLSGELPPEMGQMKRLVDLKLFTNRFNGSLPQDLGRYSNLRYFEVSMNEFSGELPKTLCFGGQLQLISAYTNNFSGNFPEEMGRCSTLQHVLAYNNRFSGEIPADLLSLRNLQTLMLGHNSFSGKLPSILSPYLSRFEIQNNNLSGEFPSNFSATMNLQVLVASWNSFSGEIPTRVTEFQNLTDLLLDHNRFSGPIPLNIGSLRHLSNLDLSTNQLTGDIPTSFTQLPSLNSLDLSDNHLSGAIPPDLGNLKLSKLNLSNNDLTGKVPGALDGPAFERSFLDNPGLCASDPSLIQTLRSCSPPGDKTQTIPPAVLIAILVVVGILTLLSIGFAAALLRAYILQRRDFGDYASWKLTSFQKLSFTEEDIRRGLTVNHLIGQGGTGKVYRVPMGDSAVAVKRIWNGQKVGRKNERLFEAEVDILGRIRHSNVVKLLCSISGDDSRLLVYEFMGNGSLHRWLHSSDSILDWPSRYRVAVGSAQGLHYMHHDCSPPVIHRDVKSSNILLDEELKPKIADFGLARLIGRSGEPETVSVVAGSLGYMAPECAYTMKVNEKSDVYSFGVVLLELATGREAHNGGGEMNLVDWAWQHFQAEKPLAEAMDQRIYDPFVSEQMFAVFKLGLLCTSKLSADRPPMNEVVDILLRHELHPDHAKSVDGEKPLSSRDVSPLLCHKSLRSQWGSKVVDDSFV
ncbi:receptor-like protein kinase HSL1 [Nymphaea colorata]|nr:receptor-like protein kinase HSL1 [Nymphaea colorata]